MGGKIRAAVLSNVNMDYAARLLAKDYEVYENQGYGEVFAPQLDEGSALNRFDPQAVVLLIDLQELVSPLDTGREEAVELWFRTFEGARRADREYLIGDAWLPRPRIEDLDEFGWDALRGLWQERLREACRHGNVHRLRWEEAGRYGSEKLWYLGKMPLSAEGFRLLAGTIRDRLGALYAPRRKVLALDLDGVLWGGVLGEDGVEGVALSESGPGGPYRDAQRLVLEMKRRGVVLAACSKNNPGDAEEMFSRHPSMVLRREDFAVFSADWREKPERLLEIARKLDLGPESLVFVDDSPAEREAVRLRVPGAAVPEVPAEAEKLPAFFCRLYRDWFQKARTTAEDREKERQYAGHLARKEFGEGLTYEEYLAALELRTERVPWSEEAEERALQLLRKTNQFNLTSRRYGRGELERQLERGWLPYLFRAADRFGDYGIIALLLVEPGAPRLDVFLMSCRAMGKRLEERFLAEVEEDLRRRGYHRLWGEYLPTGRSAPVSRLYDGLGWRLVSEDEDGRRLYVRELYQEE